MSSLSVSIQKLDSLFQNDRAILNFGSLKNTAPADSGADKSDSTIKITFRASLIVNTAYTNTTAIVTAGAEYDNQNYVWVSQASYTYNINPVSIGAGIRCNL